MSLKAMAWVWKQPLPPTEKFILLALADHANDEDYTCWPSLSHLSQKTGFTRQTIWTAIDRLFQRGALTRMGETASGSTKYCLEVGKDVCIGNVLAYATTFTEVGNDVYMVGNVVDKVGNDVASNHKNPKEPSVNPYVGLKPDQSVNGKNNYLEEATEVLYFLKDKTGFNYQALNKRGKPTASLMIIIDRLRDGASVQDCKTMIARKHREWSQGGVGKYGHDMFTYLRPSTLFQKRKFEEYVAQCVTPDEERRKP